jgi:hypothetical protein
MAKTMRRLSGALFLCAAVIATASCGASTPTASTTTPVLTTDTLGGNLTTGAQLYHLVAAKGGDVILKLTGISDPKVKLGMELGVYSSGSCIAMLSNSGSVIGTTLNGVATSTTSMCVRMFDPGTIASGATVTYEIKFSRYY